MYILFCVNFSLEAILEMVQIPQGRRICRYFTGSWGKLNYNNVKSYIVFLKQCSTCYKSWLEQYSGKRCKRKLGWWFLLPRSFLTMVPLATVHSHCYTTLCVSLEFLWWWSQDQRAEERRAKPQWPVGFFHPHLEISDTAKWVPSLNCLYFLNSHELFNVLQLS